MLFWCLNNVVLPWTCQTVCLLNYNCLTVKAVKASINVSNISYKSYTLLWYKTEKYLHQISMFTFTIFSPGSPNLGTQIRCAQNQYTTVQVDLKHPHIHSPTLTKSFLSLVKLYTVPERVIMGNVTVPGWLPNIFSQFQYFQGFFLNFWLFFKVF